MDVHRLTNELPIDQVLARVNGDTREDVECIRSTIKCVIRFVEDAAWVGVELKVLVIT
jgi:hypothetical protein